MRKSNQEYQFLLLVFTVSKGRGRELLGGGGGCAARWPSLRSSNLQRNHNWSFAQEKILHLNGPDQESFDPPRGFHFSSSMISAGRVQLRSPLKICGNFDYIPGYWEWVEDVLSRSGDMLINASLIGKTLSIEAPRSSSMKHRKGKSLPAGVHPSTLVFQSFGSSKRKRSSSSTVEDRDPKHARGARKDTFSSCGSRVVSPVRRSPEGATPSVVPDNAIINQVVDVSSSVCDQEHTELVDTRKSHECHTTEEAETILHTGAFSLWCCICTGLKGKSPEMVLKEDGSAMNTFKVLTEMGLGNFPNLHEKLQGFFHKRREMDATSVVTSPDSTSKALQKLSLMRITFEDQTSEK
ncbi:hypothetical protein LIER_05488 [Lithospermum erythrorhizon]|uniref:Uncharacterized protein n=1 Tax=Lithospermum erythrorhizon TaxID=34254 RepID=A0AAV3P2A5_LITER